MVGGTNGVIREESGDGSASGLFTLGASCVVSVWKMVRTTGQKGCRSKDGRVETISLWRQVELLGRCFGTKPVDVSMDTPHDASSVIQA